jgi:hypothetical protein
MAAAVRARHRPVEETGLADAVAGARVAGAAVAAVGARPLGTVNALKALLADTLNAVTLAVDTGVADTRGAVLARPARLALAVDEARAAHEALAVVAAARAAGFGARGAKVAKQTQALRGLTRGLVAQAVEVAVVGAALLVAAVAKVAGLTEAFASAAGAVETALLGGLDADAGAKAARVAVEAGLADAVAILAHAVHTVAARCRGGGGEKKETRKREK